MNQVPENPVKNRTGGEGSFSPRKYKILIVLSALMVTIYLTSNIMAAKLINIFGLTLFDAGTLTFPFAYMLGDVMTEIYGFRITKKIIWLTFICNIIMAAATSAGLLLPSPDYAEETARAYSVLFAFVPRILAASLAAFLSGELINAWLMEKIKLRTGIRHMWIRTVGSSAVGHLVDTVLFVIIAFSFTAPIKDIVVMIITQYLMKLGIEAFCGTPLAYAAVRWVRKSTDEDQDVPE